MFTYTFRSSTDNGKMQQAQASTNRINVLNKVKPNKRIKFQNK